MGKSSEKLFFHIRRLEFGTLYPPLSHSACFASLSRLLCSHFGAGSRDKKHPTRKVGTRSRQCRPKVPGRFAFPVARNPRTCSIWRFGIIFPAIFPGLSRSFPQEPLNRPTASSSFRTQSDQKVGHWPLDWWWVDLFLGHHKGLMNSICQPASKYHTKGC